MTKYILGAAIVLWYLILIQMAVFAVNPNDIVRLKEAGVSDEVIREIINSDAISRALISVDEIIRIKKARIGDEIILAIIQQPFCFIKIFQGLHNNSMVLNRILKRKCISILKKVKGYLMIPSIL